MAEHAGTPQGALELTEPENDPWRDLKKPFDLRLRLLHALVAAGDRSAYGQILGVGGIQSPLEGKGLETLRVSVMAELTPQQVADGVGPKDMKIPTAYFSSEPRLRQPYVCGETTITAPRDRAAFLLFDRLAGLITAVERISLAGAASPQLEDSLDEMQPPPGWTVDGIVLDGTDVVVGIIDDGCGFAHRHFIKTDQHGVFSSRVGFLWDQTWRSAPPSASWQAPPDFFYGYEIDNTVTPPIDAALNLHLKRPGVVDEDAVYRSIGYEALYDIRSGIPSHGTHVMDVAAGNGGTLSGHRGVAPGADIVFVQLPRDTVEGPSGGALHRYILDGVKYIFNRAKRLGKPAVINISYGGFTGPHDGSSVHELGIDTLVTQEDERAVVVAAGNGFEADCHASETLLPGQRVRKRWIVHPQDPTFNEMEIWYPGSARLTIEITPPGASAPLPPVGLHQSRLIRRATSTSNGPIVGWIFHYPSDTGNGDNCALIHLRATGEEAASLPVFAPAPSGEWQIHFKNVGAVGARFDAWIERDRATRRRPGRHQQSRFHIDDGYPGCTLGSISTGRMPIAVGGFNTLSQAVARYSACGPTRPTINDIGRLKPEVCAPAAEDSRGKGVLSAEVLSGLPSRMNGTSIAAPHVAGLIALVLQIARDLNCKLDADAIRRIVMQGATPNVLKPDLSHELGTLMPYKQSDVLADLVGCGKVNIAKSIALAKATCGPPSPAPANPANPEA